MRSALVFVVVSALAALGCSPEVGDPCTLTADCGFNGNRVCDTSQSGGYCTQIGCVANGCPDDAACFLFNASVAGCVYQDREIARTARSYCAKPCDDDGDCRDGYQCADVTQAPWLAIALDDEVRRKACIVPASFASSREVPSASTEPAICSPVAPQPEASDPQ